MKRSFLFLIVLPVVCLFFSSTVSGQKINRLALVSRHDVVNNSFDTLSSLSVGNGKFAFTVDATGLLSPIFMKTVFASVRKANGAGTVSPTLPDSASKKLSGISTATGKKFRMPFRGANHYGKKKPPIISESIRTGCTSELSGSNC